MKSKNVKNIGDRSYIGLLLLRETKRKIQILKAIFDANAPQVVDRLVAEYYAAHQEELKIAAEVKDDSK